MEEGVVVEGSDEHINLEKDIPITRDREDIPPSFSAITKTPELVQHVNAKQILQEMDGVVEKRLVVEPIKELVVVEGRN